MVTFTKDLLYIDDVVVYLKNERTGSSTIRKCKFIGQIVEFTDAKVKIRRLSPPDTFVTPEECQDLGIDTIYPDDVVQIIISKYQLDNWLPLPKVIGDITFYNKEELIEWVENQQNRLKQFDLTATMSQMSDVIGDTVIGIINKLEV